MFKKENWIYILLIIIVFLGFYIFFVKDQATNNGFSSITPQEAKRILDKDSGVILLDVRNPDEYSQERIPGSILIPLHQLDQQVERIITDKNETILVYCRSGVRSKQGATILVNKGYNNVLEIGGIIDWPYEKEKGL